MTVSINALARASVDVYNLLDHASSPAAENAPERLDTHGGAWTAGV
ncbi:MAG: hypothetical protein IH881_17985 [Myxococcales bacterium]|nr:hypothetical protein [Myxococcales bacterium]